MADGPRERFDAWCDWTGLSQEDLAALLGVHQTTVSRVRRGARDVGVVFAVAAERVMREWTRPDGTRWKKKVVTPADWALEMQRTAAGAR